MINLDMNENYASYPIALPTYDTQRFYPRTEEQELLLAISNVHDIKVDYLFLTSGIDAGIWFFLLHIHNKRGLLYFDVPNYCGIIHGVNLLGIKTIINHQTDYDYERTMNIIRHNDDIKWAYFCSPMNPWGTRIDKLQQLLSLCANKNIYVFLDQAYAEFCSACIPLTTVYDYENLMIARTFSKAYGLAGIRCGYVATKNKEILDFFRKYKSVHPYSLPTYSLYCATRAITDRNRLLASISQIEAEKKKLYQLFDSLSISYNKTVTNFVPVKTSNNTSKLISIANEYGVCFADLQSFLLPGFVRVSIGDKDAMITVQRIFKDSWRSITNDL